MGRRIRTSRPSPAIVIAVLALVAALAGTAVAGPQATTSASAINKKKVKKIAKKQAEKQVRALAPGVADKQIDLRAPGLSVASASSADAAATATKLGRVTVQRQAFDVADGVDSAATASCPAAQQAISGGVRVTTAADDGVVTGSRPVRGASTALLDDGATFDGWRGNVLNVGGGTSTIPANVWVICAG